MIKDICRKFRIRIDHNLFFCIILAHDRSYADKSKAFKCCLKKLREIGEVKDPQVWDYFFEMINSGGIVGLQNLYRDSIKFGVNLSGETYEKVVLFLAGNKILPLAEKFFEDMKNKGIIPTPKVFHALMVAYAPVETQRVQELFTEMRQSGHALTDFTLLAELLPELFKYGRDFNELDNIFNCMIEHTATDDSLRHTNAPLANEVMKLLLEDGQFQKVQDLIPRIESAVEKSEMTLCLMLKSAIHSLDRDRANAIIQQLMQTKRDMPFLWSLVLDLHTADNNSEMVKKTLEQIREEAIKTDHTIFAAMMRSIAIEHGVDTAEQVRQIRAEMVAAQIIPNEEILNEQLLCLLQGNLRSEVLRSEVEKVLVEIRLNTMSMNSKSLEALKNFDNGLLLKSDETALEQRYTGGALEVSKKQRIPLELYIPSKKTVTNGQEQL
eukprot:TRINITY_DN10046_c0_g1_i1.p1 TRINITY_DN10046_c0_g1~~TRINITY_DN10046_c0_g1_i1.p1  ORF type:complete len:438 (-),score=121.32 TRINITY_DN10046_c0_g1_i1:88-1401(-)